MYATVQKKILRLEIKYLANKRPLTWLIQFVKDKLPLSGWPNFLVLFLVQRPALPTETIVKFVGCTASHLHHCRHHSSSSTCNTASCSGAEGTSLRNTTEREVGPGTGTRHVADVQIEMDFRCSAVECDDRLTHSQGGGANALRLQAEFPHVNRSVSLTNASVISSLLFAVDLDFRNWKTSSGDLSAIIDIDDQLLRSNSTLAMLHVDVSRTYARPPSESGIPYKNMTPQVMTISSVDDEEKRQVRKMKENRDCRAKLLHNPPRTYVHLRSVACHRGWFWLRHFVFK